MNLKSKRIARKQAIREVAMRALAASHMTALAALGAEEPEDNALPTDENTRTNKPERKEENNG